MHHCQVAAHPLSKAPCFCHRVHARCASPSLLIDENFSTMEIGMPIHHGGEVLIGEKVRRIAHFTRTRAMAKGGGRQGALVCIVQHCSANLKHAGRVFLASSLQATRPHLFGTLQPGRPSTTTHLLGSMPPAYWHASDRQATPHSPSGRTPAPQLHAHQPRTTFVLPFLYPPSWRTSGPGCTASGHLITHSCILHFSPVSHPYLPSWRT